MTAATTQTQVRQLAKAVSAAFAAARLPDEVMNNLSITLTDLPWQLPPLQTSLAIQGYDLEQLLTINVNTTSAALYNFWGTTMTNMRQRPHQLYVNGAYKYLTSTFPKETAAVRSALFAQADLTDEYAGINLSLEVANIAAKNLPIKDMRSDESNYCVQTLDGHIFGVQNGLPMLGQNDWPTPAEGLIQMMLESTRGKASNVCLYDTIALARSVLNTNRQYFGQEFIAVDYALQALRALTLGKGCPALVAAVHKLPIDTQLWTNKVVALTEADAIMSTSICDRDKLQVLESLLVPTWFSQTAFKRNIFAGKNYPYMLEPAKVQAIKETISRLWHDVPEQLK